MTPRQKRNLRRRGVHVTLLPRDQALLRAIGRFRLARTADLAPLFFPGRHRDVLAARLRRLFDAGYLEVRVLDRAAQNVYALGPAGRVWLESQGVETQPPPRQPWDHHLAVVRLWSRLAAAAFQLPQHQLVRFVPDWAVRAQGAETMSEIVPDALMEVAGITEGRTRTRCFAVEVDRGTESLEVLRRKVRILRGVASTDEPFPGWHDLELLMVLDGPGMRRERQVLSILESEWPGQALLWTDNTDIASKLSRLLGVAETPVTGSRHGNGREAAASPKTPTDPDVTGEGSSS